MTNRILLPVLSFLFLFPFAGVQAAPTITPKWSDRIPFLNGVFYVNPKLVKDGVEYYPSYRVSPWTGEEDDHYSPDGYCALAQGFPSKAPWDNNFVQQLGAVPLMVVDTSGHFVKLDPHYDDGPVPMVLFCLNRRSDPLNWDHVNLKTVQNETSSGFQDTTITSISVDLPFTISRHDYFGAVYLESFQPSTLYRAFFLDESLTLTRTFCGHIGYPYPTELQLTPYDFPANTSFFDTSSQTTLYGFIRRTGTFPIVTLTCRKSINGFKL